MIDKLSDTDSNLATLQFQDYNNKKIITGTIIKDNDECIVLDCEHSRYWLNKTMVDWIKYDR